MTAMKAVEEYLKPYHLSYKDPSDRESYSSYREGYSDAMDIAEEAIKRAQEDAYKQAIDDALEEISDYKLEYDDPHDYSLGVSSVPNKEKEWIKKLKK